MLLSALDSHLAGYSVDSFYYLARSALVKDERFFDRFDTIFTDYVSGKESIFDEILGEVPLEWLKQQKELNLTDEEKVALDKSAQDVKKTCDEIDAIVAESSGKN